LDSGRLVPTLLLGALVVVARVSGGSFFAPGAFFALCWLAQVLLSYVVPDYPVWSGTIWWILLSCTVLCLGSMGLGSARSRPTEGPARRSTDGLAFQRPVLTLLISAAGGMAYTVLAQTGKVDLTANNHPNVFLQLLLPCQFAGPMLGGLMVASRTLSGWRRLFSLLPLLPAVLLAILFSGRMALIVPCLFWLSAYTVGELRLNSGRLPLFRPRRLLAVGIVAAVFFASAVLLGALRSTETMFGTLEEKIIAYPSIFQGDTLDQRSKGLRPALFGNVYSFSYFFRDAWDSPPPLRYGQVIFAAPLDLLNIGGQRYPYESFEIEPGEFSNIYTMFRPPVDDFGLIGSLIWWLGIGAVQGWAYRRVAHGGKTHTILLIWFYIDTSIVGGYFFRYNSLILSYVLAWLYVRSCAGSPKRRPVLNGIAASPARFGGLTKAGPGRDGCRASL
jgi:oligosaccharide repeat unit polymerase